MDSLICCMLPWNRLLEKGTYHLISKPCHCCRLSIQVLSQPKLTSSPGFPTHLLLEAWSRGGQPVKLSPCWVFSFVPEFPRLCDQSVPEEIIPHRMHRITHNSCETSLHSMWKIFLHKTRRISLHTMWRISAQLWALVSFLIGVVRPLEKNGMKTIATT